MQIQKEDKVDSSICPFCNHMLHDHVALQDDEDKEKVPQEDEMRQSLQDINRIMALIEQRLNSYYVELERYGIQRFIIRSIFRNIVVFTLREGTKYTGDMQQTLNEMINDYRRANPIIIATLRGYGVPNNRINQMILAIMRLTLENMDGIDNGEENEPGPQPMNWSNWEDLGGILTSSPAVSSWQANRLDVFGRGQNNALWHKWWDGTGWSEWEDLGGVLTSNPGAVSWGPNRIDVFGRGQNNALWHKWWDGSRWSEWEDLGGILTSGPAAASWGANRIDVFGRGQNNALWHKCWDGIRWSEWEDLGGVLTSDPAAVSWGPNRIDVFGRGQNNSLWHKWWDGTRWSEWEDLGQEAISSGPAAASTAANRLEVFARGRNNDLLFKTWNGSRWSEWESLGGVLTSDPAAVSWGNNRLDVFARGQNSHLWHIWRT